MLSLDPGTVLGLGAALIGAGFVILIVLSGRNRRKIDDTLSFAARLLGGRPPKSAWNEPIAAAVGWRRGLRVSFALASRFEQITEPTEIHAEVAGGPLPGLTLRLRPARPGRVKRDRKAGLAQVDLGDARFDDAYSVEGAPSVAVRRLLDGPTRAAILASGVHELELTTPPSAGWVRLTVPTWVHDQRRITQLIELAVSLAERASPALILAEVPLPPVLVGNPYRPVIDHSPERDARAGRDHERRQADAQQLRRESSAARWRGLYAVGLAVAVISLIAAAQFYAH